MVSVRAETDVDLAGVRAVHRAAFHRDAQGRVGYAGRRVEIKRRLLAMEGVKTVPARNDFKVDREAMYTIVTGDREYGVPTCGSRLSQSMSTLTLFGTREGAEAAGFAPCTACRPDLHPLPVSSARVVVLRRFTPCRARVPAHRCYFVSGAVRDRSMGDGSQRRPDSRARTGVQGGRAGSTLDRKAMDTDRELMARMARGDEAAFTLPRRN